MRQIKINPARKPDDLFFQVFNPLFQRLALVIKKTAEQAADFVLYNSLMAAALANLAADFTDVANQCAGKTSFIVQVSTGDLENLCFFLKGTSGLDIPGKFPQRFAGSLALNAGKDSFRRIAGGDGPEILLMIENSVQVFF